MKKVAIAGSGILAVAFIAALQLAPTQDIRKEEPPKVEPKPGEGGCPAGALESGMGPDMVRLPEGFCIDKTEVTRGQYEAWLDSKPATSGQAAACSGNADFTPTCAWDPGSNKTEQPVVCVDWCDAAAFCKAAGKRLCGKVGGGSYAFASYDDPNSSEWQAACTSGGKYEYTYGSTFDTDACRDADADDYTTWGLDDVGSFAGCHSPDAAYAKVFDLSGHVAEWDDSCVDDSADAGCRIRGGSYQHHAHGTRCAAGKELAWPRTRTVDSVGFRCCAD
ncbi:MAG TPA: SUMF1/EgtB/PvdO family nonheme iron enzyme [Polyangiaceae bacterium]|nr:SUMF1/EgtB/PvdO family nonheme iron enzyme [Polyangiaceae bacterium]